MTLTQKETTLLQDLKSQEKLCYDKYSKYSQSAHAEELKSLFGEIAAAEKSHYDTVCSILQGSVPHMPSGLNATNKFCCKVDYPNEATKSADQFLVSDMLAMEKHVSSLYDTSVFEFSDPQARRALNHIQSEEQQHGEKLYAYMSQNSMY